MPKILNERILSLSLRSATLGGKFLLIFFLAKFLSAEEVGLYGLLATTSSYLLFVVGLDFYTYSTRDILFRPEEKWGSYIKSQLLFYVTMYIASIPIFLCVFYYKLLPWYLAPWLYLITILEHIAQELNRFLVVIGRPMSANIVLFFRSGIWCVIAIPVLSLSEEIRNLNTILTLWTIGGISAIAFGIKDIKTNKHISLKGKIEFQWILKGLKTAIPLLIGTLFLRAIFTLDKYWFESLNSLEILAAYILFFNLSNALQSFLDASVFIHSYPKLIKQKNNAVEFKKESKKLLKQTLVVIIIFSLLSAASLPIIVKIIDNPNYTNNTQLFYVLLIAVSLFCLSMVPHFILYSKNKDKIIIKSHSYAFFIFIISSYILSLYTDKFAIPIGLCITFSYLTVYKYSKT